MYPRQPGFCANNGCHTGIVDPNLLLRITKTLVREWTELSVCHASMIDMDHGAMGQEGHCTGTVTGYGRRNDAGGAQYLERYGQNTVVRMEFSGKGKILELHY